MTNPTPNRSRPALLAETIDTVPSALTDHGSFSPRQAVVGGRGATLSTETRSLLHRRLRRVALISLGALSLAAARDVATETNLEDHSLKVIHAIAWLAAAAVAAWLLLRRTISERSLRLAELSTFGIPALYLIALQRKAILQSAEDGNPLAPEAAWLVLMMTYAVFIPNGWRRGAVALTMIASAPLGLLAWLTVTSADVSRVWTMAPFSRAAMLLAIAVVSLAYGIHTIGALRKEVFEARRIGQYRLQGIIGSGGMGVVHRAEHQLLKRPCAVKLIRPGRAADPKALARFEREVRTAATLSHANTIDIYDYGQTEDGTFYYVMELLCGRDLGDLVDHFGPLPAERAIHLLRPVCGALREAHAVGLVHRDIKPGNLFVAERGGVYDVSKLLDFGLVKAMTESIAIDPTAEGSITGSPLYMAPEQANGAEETDHRSDLYSLGAVAYFMLTGRPPFVAESPMQALMAHAHDEPAPPSSLSRDCPADLERIVLRCLSKRPEERFDSAARLEQALEGCEAFGKWTEQDAAQWWAANDVLPAPVSVET